MDEAIKVPNLTVAMALDQNKDAIFMFLEAAAWLLTIVDVMWSR